MSTQNRNEITTLIRLPKVCASSGRSRSSIYAAIEQGMMTRPVKIGACSAWPQHEIDAINRARIAGKSDDQIRELVSMLEESRSTLADYVFAG